MKLKKSIFISITLSILSITIIEASPLSTIKASADQFESEQSVTYVPIAVGDIVTVIPVGSGLPPHPGEEGNKDISGIDSDADGIRDDVERQISLHFQNEPRARAYSYIIAQKYQQLIENPLMPLTQHISILNEISEASSCVDHNVANGSRFTMPYVLNTYDRSVAYINSLHQLRGTILPNLKECTDGQLILDGQIESFITGLPGTEVEIRIFDTQTNTGYTLLKANDFGLHTEIGKHVQIKVKIIKKTIAEVIEVITVY